MGLFGDILGGIGKIATSIIPGPVDDIIFEGAKRVIGGGSRPQPRQQRTLFKSPPIIPQPVGVGRIQTRTQQQQPQQRPSTGASVSINPPFFGPPGAGIDFSTGVGRTAAPRAGRGALPMMGPFGVEPEVRNVATRRCPRGAVLAIDGLCYPKQMVPKTFRMWKPEPRPVVSRSDQKAIQKANRAKKRLVNLTKKAGAHASMSKPRRRSKSSSNGQRPIIISQND